jgi:hypothetical protein
VGAASRRPPLLPSPSPQPFFFFASLRRHVALKFKLLAGSGGEEGTTSLSCACAGKMSRVGVVLEVDVNGEELFFVDKVRCAAACGSLSPAPCSCSLLAPPPWIRLG